VLGVLEDDPAPNLQAWGAIALEVLTGVPLRGPEGADWQTPLTRQADESRKRGPSSLSD
jgi:hypothetical protein